MEVKSSEITIKGFWVAKSEMRVYPYTNGPSSGLKASLLSLYRPISNKLDWLVSLPIADLKQ